VLAVEQTDKGIRRTASHSHDSGQLLGSARGLLSVTTNKGCWVVPATHAIWMPPREVHGLSSHGLFSGWSVYIAERACGDLPATPRTLLMSDLLREAVHRAATWTVNQNNKAQIHLADVIIDEIATLPEVPLGLPMPTDRRLVRITEALIGNPGDQRSLDGWALTAHIAARTLSRRFVAETGFTFTAWRQRVRILRSLELLAEGKTVATIALDLGYENVSAFISMFRRTLGSSPTQYTHRDPLWPPDR
jgi:AraC-like DNA-binding protein